MSTNHTNHTNEVACPRLRDRGGSVISTAKDTKKAGPLRGPEWLDPFVWFVWFVDKFLGAARAAEGNP